MDTVKQRILEWIDTCQSLSLSSLAPTGHPHTSYAPYAYHQGVFYIFISEAARHYECLTHAPQCSIMLIESEEQAQQIFARKRVILGCHAHCLTNESPSYTQGIEALTERFEDMIATLRQMQDFHLFALTPHEGEAVFGFGEAYTIETPFDTITPKRAGHRRT